MQIVPVLGAYDGMFKVTELTRLYKEQLQYQGGEDIAQAIENCGCSIM